VPINFLLVRHSNLGPILHRLRDIGGFCTPPLFQPNYGVFPFDQIADVGVSPSIYLKLFVREIIFISFQPMWSR